VILGHKAPLGEEEYWFGRIDGVEKKFRRIICGVILPVLDRQEGGVVVIGEKFSISGPQDFTGLAVALGAWPEIERALVEYDQQLKFRDAITPTEPERKLLWRLPLSMMVRTWHAPAWALTEVGRQKVNQLGVEGRLHMDAVESDMRGDPDVATKAAQVALCYAIDWNPPYITKKARPIEMHPVGTRGL